MDNHSDEAPSRSMPEIIASVSHPALHQDKSKIFGGSGDEIEKGPLSTKSFNAGDDGVLINTADMDAATRCVL